MLRRKKGRDDAEGGEEHFGEGKEVVVENNAKYEKKSSGAELLSFTEDKNLLCDSFYAVSSGHSFRSIRCQRC